MSNHFLTVIGIEHTAGTPEILLDNDTQSIRILRINSTRIVSEVERNGKGVWGSDRYAMDAGLVCDVSQLHAGEGILSEVSAATERNNAADCWCDFYLDVAIQFTCIYDPRCNLIPVFEEDVSCRSKDSDMRDIIGVPVQDKRIVRNRETNREICLLLDGERSTPGVVPRRGVASAAKLNRHFGSFRNGFATVMNYDSCNRQHSRELYLSPLPRNATNDGILVTLVDVDKFAIRLVDTHQGYVSSLRINENRGIWNSDSKRGMSFSRQNII